MHLLILGINYAPELAGIGKYTGEMAEWLAARGHEGRVGTAPPYYPAWGVAAGYSAWRYRREVLAGISVWRRPRGGPARPSGVERGLQLATLRVTDVTHL